MRLDRLAVQMLFAAAAAVAAWVVALDATPNISA